MRHSNVLDARLAVALVIASTWSASISADELQFDVKELFSQGVSSQLQLTSDCRAIELRFGTLWEDDGPAAGFSYQPNLEKLTAGIWIKKELVIPAPRAKQATLLVGRGGELTSTINGKDVPLSFIGKQGNYWQAYRFSANLLKPGKNEFVLRGTGSVWIARDDEYATGSLKRTSHPNRSFKSQDAGKTWSDHQLGTKNDIDGEYYVRVFLDQYCEQGKLTLNVIDVGNLAGKSIGPPLLHTGPIRIKADTVTANSATITFHARTGTTFVPDADHWSEWTTIDSADSVITKPKGRYLQIQANFATGNPLITPKLNRLTISATPSRPKDWTQDIQVDQFINQQIIRSSIPFRYEPFDRKELAKLRSKFQLDKVVAGAESELEILKRLAIWSATRWQRIRHLKDSYPSFNALEILDLHKDGTPVGGFCQQYNLVFLQACECFGFVGRLVSIGPGNRTDKIRSGHETVEIWSNQFNKWIYIDGNTAWYAVDHSNSIPLSLWELRQRQLAAFRGEDHRPIRIIVLAETKYHWKDIQNMPAFVELRLIPRSNFLQQKTPLPLNQGMRGWFWPGHYVWADDKEPARLLYPNRVVQRNNFEWTLNQCRLVLEAKEDPGQLRVHVDSVTPGFELFAVSINGKKTTHKNPAFAWSLTPGKNSLSVISRNTAGREGPASSISIDFDKK